jgi:hypothetical protein
MYSIKTEYKNKNDKATRDINRNKTIFFSVLSNPMLSFPILKTIRGKRVNSNIAENLICTLYEAKKT